MNRFAVASLAVKARPLFSKVNPGITSFLTTSFSHKPSTTSISSSYRHFSTTPLKTPTSTFNSFSSTSTTSTSTSTSTAQQQLSSSSSSSWRSISSTSNKKLEDSDSDSNNSRYSWIDEEAHTLINKAYARHKALSDKSQSYPPSLSVSDLERIGTPYHYPPQDFIDSIAFNLMKFLRIFVHAFFREKYDHHAVCLETVAAVPGIVGSFHRHLRSLRRMKRDHSWIGILQEEAENERMHLLIFMKVTNPTLIERSLVIIAQAIYLTFYSSLYLLLPRAAHRLTGYLEEEAHRAYTDYIKCIDNGKIENKKAPHIAKQYYQLSDNATMRDVLLHVRADEAMHRDVNHQFGNMYKEGEIDIPLEKE